MMLLRSFNKSCFWDTAPNYIYIYTEAERPFYFHGSERNTKTTASTVSFGAILSCEILDFGLQLSVCVDGIIQGKATE